jgi:NADPH-dependent 7-cyano-7-deazaguanine reductase QueF
LDVLCLVETKTDDLDEIIIPVFITKFKNRKAFANRKSEGIMLDFVKYINPLNTESSVAFMV